MICGSNFSFGSIESYKEDLAAKKVRRMFHDHHLFSQLKLGAQRSEIFESLGQRDDILAYASIALALNDDRHSEPSFEGLPDCDREIAAMIEPVLERDSSGCIIGERKLPASRTAKLRFSPLPFLSNLEAYDHPSGIWISKGEAFAKELRERYLLPEKFDRACRKAWGFDLAQVLSYLAYVRAQNPTLFLFLYSDAVGAGAFHFPHISIEGAAASAVDVAKYFFPHAQCSVATIFRILREVARAKEIIAELIFGEKNNAKTIQSLFQGSDAELQDFGADDAQGRFLSSLSHSSLAIGRRFMKDGGNGEHIGSGVQTIESLREDLELVHEELTKNLRAVSKSDDLCHLVDNDGRIRGSGGTRNRDCHRHFGFNAREISALVFVQTSNCCSLPEAAPTHSLARLASNLYHAIGVSIVPGAYGNTSEIDSRAIDAARAFDVVLFGRDGYVSRNAGFDVSLRKNLIEAVERLTVFRCASYANGSASAAFLKLRNAMLKKASLLEQNNLAEMRRGIWLTARLESALTNRSMDPTYIRVREQKLAALRLETHWHPAVRKYVNELTRVENKHQAKRKRLGAVPKHYDRALLLKGAVTHSDLLYELA